MTGGMVIVGAGECGVRAAVALRENGYDGNVVLLGAEPHAPYERPPMSKEMMRATEQPSPRTIASVERLDGLGIVFRPGTAVTSIDTRDRKVRTSSDTLPFDRLLISTGARARRIEGMEGRKIVSLRTFDDALRIRRSLHGKERIVVVGGGFIGLEVAAAGREAGAEVTVVESMPRLLARGVPEELAQCIERRHREAGVVFHLSTGVATIRDDTVVLLDGASIEADLVVVGVGSVPATELAAEAGLAIDNGIAVDDRLRTSCDEIFAAGDCCSFPMDLYNGRRVRLESWRSAQEQGNLAARNMLGADETISSLPWFWSDQYDMVLQIAGLPDEGRITVRRSIEGGVILFHTDHDGRLVAASGLGVGNAVARDIRLAEILITRRARPDPNDLARNDVKLKTLLKDVA